MISFKTTARILLNGIRPLVEVRSGVLVGEVPKASAVSSRYAHPTSPSNFLTHPGAARIPGSFFGLIRNISRSSYGQPETKMFNRRKTRREPGESHDCRRDANEALKQGSPPRLEETRRERIDTLVQGLLRRLLNLRLKLISYDESIPPKRIIQGSRQVLVLHVHAFHKTF